MGFVGHHNWDTSEYVILSIILYTIGLTVVPVQTDTSYTSVVPQQVG